MLEADFLRNVLELAKVRGWLSYHPRTSLNERGRYMTAVQGDGAGFPDLVLVRERVVFAELKSEKGVISEQQKMWIERLLKTKAEVYVWRPSDWTMIGGILS